MLLARQRQAVGVTGKGVKERRACCSLSQVTPWPGEVQLKSPWYLEPCALWGLRGLQAHGFESCSRSECRLGFLTRNKSLLAGNHCSFRHIYTTFGRGLRELVPVPPSSVHKEPQAVASSVLRQGQCRWNSHQNRPCGDLDLSPKLPQMFSPAASQVLKFLDMVCGVSSVLATEPGRVKVKLSRLAALVSVLQCLVSSLMCSR
ncbi:hypothetical protein E2C01_033259 [Portunus trituberculatus]|uniref:Uncharacterized protein n=1 Tax=Portunus trituberculatus TaxID=210409 RepID=A0A5B7EZN8_PORTR|nr:hypothetical protein [Portunus trituberculatus]